MPPLRESVLRVRLAKPLRASIEQGHPWVFDRALHLPPSARRGQLAQLFDAQGPIATAYLDPGSPIAARILAIGPAPLAVAGVTALIEASVKRRTAQPDLAHTNAVRLIHGEADGCPGLVLDQYADVAVAVFDGEGAHTFWGPHIPMLQSLLSARGVRGMWCKRTGDKHRAPVGQPVERAEIFEGKARFIVDVVRGQKTGFFLDQRPNRLDIGALSRNKSVLNLFAYTGGFSIHAALGGASRVDSVDIARPATQATLENTRISGVEAVVHPHTGDAFAYLDRALSRRQTWDVVIVDPPSFAPNERSKAAGLAAYRELNALAMRVVATGGVFASASCSSHLRRHEFAAMLAAAAVGAGRPFVVTRDGGAGSDHPVAPAFPEGDYLKFARGICGPSR